MESNSILKKSLLLIPDISGFTKFINETEIIHGVHIISELLEIIIKNNSIGLKVAEIEGDAVLFYKHTNSRPTLNEIYEQCKKMFLAFHEHIKRYERDRICNCGSCSNTPELTLKFIVHYGEVIERNILGHFQLMGADVTTAHKLMKNNISENEYILISENSISEAEHSILPEWFKLQESYSENQDIGKANYHYEKLTPLLSEVPEIEPRKKSINTPVQLIIEREFNYDKLAVFNLVSSLERKHEWVVGVKEVVFDKEKIERVGTQHDCITSINTLHIESIMNDTSEDNFIYAESVEASGIFPASQHVFTVKEISPESCLLLIEIHFKPSSFNNLIFKKILGSSLNKALDKLTTVLESDATNIVSDPT
ncbi:MAG: DUF2652 domain-containing protein [Flavobacteriales bacterium]|nr:DUF2652 domain-containing protein [Flavobacteriales bacterium]